MYNIILETSFQSRFDAGYRMLGAGAWDDPEGWYEEGGGRGGSRVGTYIYPWQIHVDVWQNQYSIVK